MSNVVRISAQKKTKIFLMDINLIMGQKVYQLVDQRDAYRQSVTLVALKLAVALEQHILKI